MVSFGYRSARYSALKGEQDRSRANLGKLEEKGIAAGTRVRVIGYKGTYEVRMITKLGCLVIRGLNGTYSPDVVERSGAS